MIKNNLFKMLDSKLGLLLVGFILTSILGTYINERYHQKVWEETQNSELLKRKLDKQEGLVNDVSMLISNRAFPLERLKWALEYHTDKEKNKIDQKKREKIVKLWDEYYANVIKWNENYKMHYIRLKYLAGGKVANMFYVSEKEANSVNPNTVYGKFVQNHKVILDLRNCVLKGCDQHESLSGRAEQTIEDLNASIDIFLLELYISLDQNARQIVNRKNVER